MCHLLQIYGKIRRALCPERVRSNLCHVSRVQSHCVRVLCPESCAQSLVPRVMDRYGVVRLSSFDRGCPRAHVDVQVPPWCLPGASSVPPCTPRLGPGTLRGHEKSSGILIQIHNVPRATPKDAPKAANVAPQPLFCTIFGPRDPSKVPLGDPHKG